MNTHIFSECDILHGSYPLYDIDGVRFDMPGGRGLVCASTI